MQTKRRMRIFCRIVLAIFLLMPLAGGLAKEMDMQLWDSQPFADSGEYVQEDPENGLWRYLSPTLRIEITRHHDEERRIIYTVADIRTKEDAGERFRMTPKNLEKRMAKMDYVPNIAKENGVVFATSSDYAHLRIQQKIRVGILIRDQKVLSTQTRSSKSTKFPNLDTLALFEDGDMKLSRFNEFTAEEYLDMGAVDVLAFGPILVEDGIINEAILRKFGQYREPRVGIGMVEKGHYVSIMVEGRHKDSRGISTIGLAELFVELGCPMAFNLDGGQSATMSFMGKQIIRVGHQKKLDAPARSTAEIFGIGHTELPME